MSIPSKTTSKVKFLAKIINVFQGLKYDHSQNMGENIEYVVLNIPSDFSLAEKDALKKAGKGQNLEVLSIFVDEDCFEEVVVSYLNNRKETKTVITLDLRYGFEFETCVFATSVDDEYYLVMEANYTLRELLTLKCKDIKEDKSLNAIIRGLLTR